MGITRKWNTCKNMSAWFLGKEGGGGKKRRLCCSSPSFLPFYCHVWAFSISWTRLSQNLEQANMTWEGVLRPRLTMYFIQTPKSLQNYSCTFKWMQYGPRNIYTHFTKEVGQWMVIQWVKTHTFVGQWMVEPFISTKGPVISSTTSP